MGGIFEHTNRKGDVYYLQANTAKGGKLKYSFARKPTGAPVEHLPDGYEVREHPETAQVVIRRIQPSPILPAEKTLLETMIREQNDGLLFIVEVDGPSLVVYTANMTTHTSEERANMIQKLFGADISVARHLTCDMLSRAKYSKAMQFTLVDPQARRFTLDRWHSKGSIGGWYFLESVKPLPELVDKYVRHLG